MIIKKLIPIFIGTLIFSSCDKVKDAHPAVTGNLEVSLYPGDIEDYEFPVFTDNPNTLRNVLIEDFTGHTCSFCPSAAKEAEEIALDNPGRVYISTIHSGKDGIGSFQQTDDDVFSYDFTNEIGLEIGIYFGHLPNSGFGGNPKGTVSRIVYGGKLCMGAGDWRAATEDVLALPLEVNLQSVVNYFPQTDACFIHTEVELLNEELNTDSLGFIVALYQDSIVKPQKDKDLGTIYDYVHRDLLKKHINGAMNGQSFDIEKVEGNKFYFDNSYALNGEYDPTNAHFLIYVINKNTKEVLHVIKEPIVK